MSKKRSKADESPVRFALVPSPGCTCEVCLMHASQGFHYTREFNPHGGKNKSCKCRFMPGIEGETAIEGYDDYECYRKWKTVKAMREGIEVSTEQMKRLFKATGFDSLQSVDVGKFSQNWKYCAETCGSEEFPDILKEALTRENCWLFCGIEPEITFLDENQKFYIERDRPHELITAKNLKRYGFKCAFKDDSKSSDLSGGYELSSLIRAEGAGAIDRALRHAAAKSDLSVCVIDNSWKRISDNKAVSAIKYRMRKRGVFNVLYISNNGKLKRIMAEGEKKTPEENLEGKPLALL